MAARQRAATSGVAGLESTTLRAKGFARGRLMGSLSLLLVAAAPAWAHGNGPATHRFDRGVLGSGVPRPVLDIRSEWTGRSLPRPGGSGPTS